MVETCFTSKLSKEVKGFVPTVLKVDVGGSDEDEDDDDGLNILWFSDFLSI